MVQIRGQRSGALAEVGHRLVKEFSRVVDINFGCPVQRSCNAESGSYLLRYPDRVGEIVRRVVAACDPTPVTAKIRLGPSESRITAGEVAEAVEAAGGAALTVHGRTARQMFRGQADWDQIARVKEHLRRIPLVGNGDLRSAAAVVEASSLARRQRDDRSGDAGPALAAQAAAAHVASRRARQSKRKQSS